MAYETKVLLMAIYRLVERAKSMEEVKLLIEDIANIEGVILNVREPEGDK